MRNQGISLDTLKGQTVVARYGKHKCYEIEKVTDLNPFDTFPVMRDGRMQQTTYKDYYEGIYKITINQPRQPLIEVVSKEEQQIQLGGKKMTKQKKKIYLVP